jgi:CubicO group peptidase (beta-lactamase class C family)
MSRISRTTLAFLAAFFVSQITHSANAQSSIPADHRYAAVAEQIERLIRHEIDEKQLPGFSVALVDDQQIVWAQGFGFADPDNRIPATAETVYRVGSVSKLYTAIGIMQQVERGHLNLDAPVSEYLPSFHPPNPFQKPITLRELMSHRAGLVREPPLGSYFDSSEPSLAEVVNSLNSTGLVYEPGTHTKYSNAGDAVAGRVLEAVTKQPYTQYLQDNVLRPLQLDSSAFLPLPAITAKLAKGYMWNYDGKVFRAPTFELGTGPAGNLYSNVIDQARFLSWIFTGGRGANGSVLKSETLAQMFLPQSPGSGYGIGFALLNLDGIKMVGHRGGVYGFSTEMLAMPEEKLGVVTITNMDESTEVAWHVAFTALRLMLAVHASKPLPPLRLTTKIPVEDMPRLEGRYQKGEKSIEIFQRSGRLFIEPMDGGGISELRQFDTSLVTDDRNAWGWRISPVANGIEVGGGNGEILQRVTPQESSPPPTKWHDLLGDYGWDYNPLHILERNGQLTALLEMDFNPLTPISADIWQFPRNSAYDGERLTFLRDKNGCPTKARVGEIVFPRISPCAR